MVKLKNIIIKIFQNLKIKADFKSLNLKIRTKFIILLLVLLLVTITGILFKIYFFQVYVFYYVLILSIFAIGTYLGLNKYSIFSEYNIIIKLGMPIILFVLIDYDQIILGFSKFVFILAVRFCFSTMLSLHASFLILIILLLSSFIFPIISSYLFGLCIFRMNPENNNLGEHRLPHWYARAQQEQDFLEHQNNLREMLKNTEHGINYRELIPQEINDFNIAKANNALESLSKDLRGFYGQVKLAGLGSEIIEKIHNNELSNEGPSMHSKLTYEQLAALKFYGVRINVQNTPGFNGILQKGYFTNTEPYNIEIVNSISSDSDVGSRLINEISSHKKSVKDQIAATNNQTWVVD